MDTNTEESNADPGSRDPVTQDPPPREHPSPAAGTSTSAGDGNAAQAQAQQDTSQPRGVKRKREDDDDFPTIKDINQVVLAYQDEGRQLVYSRKPHCDLEYSENSVYRDCFSLPLYQAENYVKNDRPLLVTVEILESEPRNGSD